MERSDAAHHLYQRLESPTQPTDGAAFQHASGIVRGYPARGSLLPKVKAFDGPLPAGKGGIEFTTDVPPDRGCAPGLPTWSGSRPGVVAGIDELRGSFVEIRVAVIRNTQI